MIKLEMQRDIMVIQNTVWKIYKKYLEHQDVDKYFEEMNAFGSQYTEREPHVKKYAYNICFEWLELVFKLNDLSKMQQRKAS